MREEKEKNKKKYKHSKIFISIFYFVIFLFSFFLGGQIAHAATTINFSPESGLYMIGDTVRVRVVIASDISVNAVSAKIKFSSDHLTLTSISKTGSVVSLWAQEPTFSNANGTAELDGVILNGYKGNSGTAATLVFKAKSIGLADLSFETGSVYANDGSGTDVASGKSTAELTIIANKNIVPPPPITKSDTNIVILEVKDNTNNFSPNKFSITATRTVKDNLYYLQIDALAPVIWIDAGTHIYQAPALPQGEHTLKAMAVDNSLNVLSGSLDFSTAVLKVPVLTYYLKDIYPDEFMVLKGTADPSVDVEITLTNKNTGDVIVNHVATNSDGNFTYVPENKLALGTYSITMRADTNNIFSNYMPSVLVINQEHIFNLFITRMNNYLTLLTPVIALLRLDLFF